MKKIQAMNSFVVVKSHTSPRGKEAVEEALLNRHKQVLFKGTRMECILWSRARNVEEEKKVEEWSELRKKIRVPLPSDNVDGLNERLAELEKGFDLILQETKKLVATNRPELPVLPSKPNPNKTQAYGHNI